MSPIIAHLITENFSKLRLTSFLKNVLSAFEIKLRKRQKYLQSFTEAVKQSLTQTLVLWNRL